MLRHFLLFVAVELGWVSIILVTCSIYMLHLVKNLISGFHCAIPISLTNSSQPSGSRSDLFRLGSVNNV